MGVKQDIWRKSIPMIALWCHHSVEFLMTETQQPITYIVYYFDYLLFLLF